MTSNAYIATDGQTVMKVGKTNDVKRREKQIANWMKLNNTFRAGQGILLAAAVKLEDGERAAAFTIF
jgi:hypothetical protein